MGEIGKPLRETERPAPVRLPVPEPVFPAQTPRPPEVVPEPVPSAAAAA